LGAVVSCFGAINGWILIGAFSAAVARRIVSSRFAALSPRVPVFAMVTAVVLITLMLAFNYSGAKSLVSIFNFAILLSTLATLIPYVFCSIATVLIPPRRNRDAAARGCDRVAIAIAFV
jgi:APA family basic amino acid/polyamine antiporter